MDADDGTVIHSLSDICDGTKTEFASLVDSFQHSEASTEMIPEINLHNADGAIPLKHARRRKTQLDQTIAGICTNVPNYCPCYYRLFNLCIDHSSNCVHLLLLRGFFTVCYNNLAYLVRYRFNRDV